MMKKVITLSIIIIAVAATYYLAFFLPSQKLAQNEQKKQAFLFEKQTECRNICDKLYKDDKEALGDTSVMNPRYTYNENKNACFYSGGWISSVLHSLTKRVVNCQTNEELVTFMTINNEVLTNFCGTCVNSSNEYEIKEKEFMGN